MPKRVVQQSDRIIIHPLYSPFHKRVQTAANFTIKEKVPYCTMKAIGARNSVPLHGYTNIVVSLAIRHTIGEGESKTVSKED